MRLALGRIEVRRSKRQVHVVNCHELGDRTLFVLVPSDLEILAAAQRQLSRQLLKLRPELRHLLSHLPVHKLDQAIGLFLLFKSDFTNDLVSGRTVWWEQFLHDPSREVYAALSQHGVHDLAGTCKRCTARSVIAQASTTQAFFVLLVALLAGLFVFF